MENIHLNVVRLRGALENSRPGLRVASLKGKSVKALFTAAVALSLTACNGSESSTDKILAPTSSSETPDPTTPSAPAQSQSAAAASGRLFTGPDELEKYVVKFVDDAKAYGIDVLPAMNPTLEIQISSLDTYGESVIGLCETSEGKRRVTFDPDFWNTVSETQKELLVHHELGHCVLHRAHQTNRLPTNAYASIMYPMLLTNETYLGNASYYLQELFTEAGAPLTTAEAQAQGVDTHICDLDH